MAFQVKLQLRFYPIKELLASVKQYMDSLTDSRVATIEYILISGVNDHRQHARELAELLRPLPCKINLIPFNPIAGSEYKRSSNTAITSFRQILQEAGYKVGLYTSPHLKDFRERIKVNGQVVSKQFVIGFITRNKSFLEANTLSFFEMTVGMAFDFFSKQKVDIAIIEVGLGGRLDSTNIITIFFKNFRFLNLILNQFNFIVNTN